MTSLAKQTIYYLLKFGGQLATGLGQGLMDRGFDLTGRDTRGDFRLFPLWNKFKPSCMICKTISGKNWQKWSAIPLVLTFFACTGPDAGFPWQDATAFAHRR